MTDQPVADERLVRAARDGDRDAFGELVRRYQKLVGSIAWRSGVGRDEIEDVVSEVFLKLFKNLHQYRPEHAFVTWLYKLAANHVLDHGRRARRRPAGAELGDEVPDRGPDPAQQSEREERAALVRGALAALPLRYRQPLFLVYVESLPLERVAAMLGVPLGTVKSRLLRGRRALHEALVREHPEHFGASSALP